MAVARLAHVQRADVIRLHSDSRCSFRCVSVAPSPTTASVTTFVEVGAGVVERRVALDHRRLGEPVEHDEVVRLRRPRARARVAHEQQVDRPRDLDLAADVQHRAVVEEAVLSAVNVCPSNVATLPRYCSTSSGSASYARLSGTSVTPSGSPAARRAGVEAAVHEHQRVPVRRAEGERCELRGLHAMRRRREQVELPLGDRRDGGEVPVLVLRRREAERLEPGDGRQPQRPRPIGRGRAVRRRDALELPQVRLDHAIAPRAASRSPSPRARARSFPPERTIRPPASTCT